MLFTVLSPEEVKRKYNRAENKAQAIEILCGLTASTKPEMLKFLGLSKTPVSKYDPRSGAGRPLAVFDKDLALKLLNEGASAEKVAATVNVARSTIYVWMERNGLKTQHQKKLQDRENRRLELYRNGATDIEISAAEGITQNSVGYWRRKQGLPPNNKK